MTHVSGNLLKRVHTLQCVNKWCPKARVLTIEVFSSPDFISCPRFFLSYLTWGPLEACIPIYVNPAYIPELWKHIDYITGTIALRGCFRTMATLIHKTRKKINKVIKMCSVNVQQLSCLVNVFLTSFSSLLGGYTPLPSLLLFYCFWVGGGSGTSPILAAVWSRIIFPAVRMPFTQVSAHRHPPLTGNGFGNVVKGRICEDCHQRQ